MKSNTGSTFPQSSLHYVIFLLMWLCEKAFSYLQVKQEIDADSGRWRACVWFLRLCVLFKLCALANRSEHRACMFYLEW